MLRLLDVMLGSDKVADNPLHAFYAAEKIHDTHAVQNMLMSTCREMIRLLAFIKFHWVVFTIFALAAITTLSLWPLEKLPQVPGTDKIHHIMAYAVLMFPTALRKSDKWIMLGLLFIAYSGAIEFLQPYVNRHSEWLDIAANAMGVVCGLIIAELINTAIDPPQ